MNIPLTIAALGLLLATSVQADPFLVVPRRSLGRTPLGRNGAAELKNLSPPTASDAAMGRDELVRVSRPTRSRSSSTLYIRTSNNSVLDPPAPGVTIDEIRATSPLFHTRSGISPGRTVAQIHRRVLTYATHCISVSVYPPDTGHSLATPVQVSDLIQSGHS